MSELFLSRSGTISLLKKHGLILKKTLGQSFLVDPQVLERIVDAVDPGPEDGLLEVGPGAGAMTRALAMRAGAVTALEFDTRFLPALRETLAGAPPVNVVHGDVLKANLRELLLGLGDRRRKVAANLPYYITTPALIRLLDLHELLERIVVLVQKEVADRLAASPGAKDYGSLSVFAQFRSRPVFVSQVSNASFLPPPKVTSAIVRLEILPEPAVSVPDEALFFQITRAAFGQRRKTLLNALSGGLSMEKDAISGILRNAGIDPDARGETLGLPEFAKIAWSLSDAVK